MTNGLASIVQQGQVVLKVVAGCNGFNAASFASSLRDRGWFERNYVWQYALDSKFGCRECLVVVDAGGGTFSGQGQLESLYYETFEDPRFNPRRDSGAVEHFEIIELDAEGQPIWPEVEVTEDDGELQ